MIYKFITKSGAEKFNDSEQSFIAWASKSSIDREDEEIDASGWELMNYEKNPVVPLFHNPHQFPIAKAKWVKKSPRINPEGLLFQPVFAKTELGMEAYYLYKEGFMSGFSVGFDPLEWEDDEGKNYTKAVDGEFVIWQKDYIQKKKKKPRCKYLKQELLEISGVLVPAHPDALIQTRGIVKTKELAEYIDILIQKQMGESEKISLSWKKATEIQTIQKEMGFGYITITMDKIEMSQSDPRLGELKSFNRNNNTIDASEYDDDIEIKLENDLAIEIIQEDEIEVNMQALFDIGES